MGMSASQARLLFITSRQNDVSAKMQRISNQNMVLARDSDEVADKYNKMLNNPTKTVQLKDGSLTYDGLMGSGALTSGQLNLITVGVNGINGDASLKNRVVLNSTLAGALSLTGTGSGDEFKSKFRSVDALKAKLEQVVTATDATATGTGTAAKEKADWNTKVNSIISQYGEYPAIKKQSNIKDLFSNCPGIKLETWDNGHLQNIDGANNELSTGSLWSLINVREDKVIKIADDGDKKGVPFDQAANNVQNIGNAIIGSIAIGLGMTDTTGLYKELQNYLDDLKSSIYGYSDKNKHSSENKAVNGAKNDARSTIIGNGTDTGGTDHDFFYLNVSELARRLVSVVINNMAGGSASVGTAPDSDKVSLDTSKEYTFVFNSKGYSVSKYENEAKREFTNANYTSFTSWTEALNMLKKRGATTTTNSTTGTDVAGSAMTGDYYQNLYNKLASNGWYVDTDTSSLQTKLENGQYYLNQTTLSNNSGLYETVEDSDYKAKAEAYYETEKEKIERKEKQLDTELTKLQTEYSSLTQDYNSVKSILDANIQRSFTYCQNG